MMKTVVAISALIEAATGLALLAIPELVGRVLLNTALSDSGMVVARLAGIALLSLGLGCWPRHRQASRSAVRGLFTYNLLAAAYLGFLRGTGVYVSELLWPVVALHGLFALILAYPAYESFVSRQRPTIAHAGQWRW
jgi:hypothetical protein